MFCGFFAVLAREDVVFLVEADSEEDFFVVDLVVVFFFVSAKLAHLNYFTRETMIVMTPTAAQ